MVLECLQFLLQEITAENLNRLDTHMIEKLLNWRQNGSITTTDEFHKLDFAARRAVIDFIFGFELYEEVHIGDDVYLLVHTGLGNFASDKEAWEYELGELIWERPDYETAYYPDKYVIIGHTPTMAIEANPRPGNIYRANHHIAIDCGAGFGGAAGMPVPGDGGGVLCRGGVSGGISTYGGGIYGLLFYRSRGIFVKKQEM